MAFCVASVAAQEIPPKIGGSPIVMSLEKAGQKGAPSVMTENAVRVSQVSLSLGQDERGRWFPGASDSWRFRGLGGEVQIELFPGEVLWMKGLSVEDADNASSWVGEVLHPEPGIAVITRTKDGVYGTFDVGVSRYALVSAGGQGDKAFAKEVSGSRNIGGCPVGGAQGERRKLQAHGFSLT